jgi:hypothetical protein
MHGLNGGRWGQLATTMEIQRSTKVTTLRRATVSLLVVNRSTSGLPHRSSWRIEPRVSAESASLPGRIVIVEVTIHTSTRRHFQ